MNNSEYFNSYRVTEERTHILHSVKEEIDKILRQFTKCHQGSVPFGTAKTLSSKFVPFLLLRLQARCDAVATYPGHQFLTEEGAYPIVKRGVTMEAGSQRVQFKHDIRLSERSPIYFSEEQACAYLDSTKCPVFLVTAARGWPYSQTMMEHRLQRVKNAVPYFQAEHYENAGHHLHLEPDTASDVTSRISAFLDKCRNLNTKL